MTMRNGCERAQRGEKGLQRHGDGRLSPAGRSVRGPITLFGRHILMFSCLQPGDTVVDFEATTRCIRCLCKENNNSTYSLIFH